MGGGEVAERTFGAVDAAYERVAPTHRQGGGHAPRFRAFAWGQHGGFPTWKWLGVCFTGQEEQARWIQKMNDNPFFPKTAVLHQVKGNTPGTVTTPNHMRASVPVTKFTGVATYIKFGMRPWWQETFFNSAVRYVGWGGVAVGVGLWAIRYQYANVRHNYLLAAKWFNKNWGTNMSVPTWTL